MHGLVQKPLEPSLYCNSLLLGAKCFLGERFTKWNMTNQISQYVHKRFFYRIFRSQFWSTQKLEKSLSEHRRPRRSMCHWMNILISTWTNYASVNSTCAQLPPGQLRGICPPCQSQGWGICKFCTARGQGICQPPAHFRAFDTHAVFYQNITTQKVLLEKKQIGSSVKDRNKL